MNLDETATLLAAVAATDRHAPRPSRSTARVWANLLDDVPIEPALRVVREHYRRTAETITPDQVRAGWRAQVDRDRRQLHHRPCADPSVARRGMAAVYAATGWTRPPAQAAALAVPCPIEGCGAPVGVICLRLDHPEKRHRTFLVHPSRLNAGRAATEHADAHGTEHAAGVIA